MRLLLAGVLLAAAVWPAAGHAVTIGQIDTFGDGSTQNWIVGIAGAAPPAPPATIPSGGPQGEGDGYLLLTAIADAVSGNRIAVINQTQWAGNYLGGSVDAISLDAINLGDAPLALRLLLSDPEPGSLRAGNNIALSIAPVNLPPGGGWRRVAFPVDPASLTARRGSVQDALLNVTDLRVFHNPAPSFPPPTIDAQLGLDNIAARALSAPVAAAGFPRTVHAGSLVQLDGGASFDPNGHTPLKFSWTLESTPPASGATLAGAGTVSPSFVADRLGAYGVALTVTNIRGLSDPSGRIDIQAVNAGPIADPGRSRTVRQPGLRVTLNGSRSRDPDADPLAFRWTWLSRPRGSRARLRGAGTARPSFVPDRAGTYRVRLVVSDHWTSSPASAVRIQVKDPAR